jgi:hypothetical protein
MCRGNPGEHFAYLLQLFRARHLVLRHEDLESVRSLGKQPSAFPIGGCEARGIQRRSFVQYRGWFAG